MTRDLTLVHGGTVVSATGATAMDVLVDGERIASLHVPGGADALLGGDVRRIDATGRYVLPGGVDVHTHMSLPFGGTEASDDFATGTAAAAWGGTTTIVDFAVQTAGQDVEAGLAAWHAKAEGVAAVDYGFHMIVGGVDDAALKAMDRLVADEGVTSFKLFTAYPGVFYSDDGQVLRAMQTARENGAMIMMHAENGLAIDVLAAQAAARGDLDPVWHGLTRPPVLEGEATHRCIALAEVAGECPVYFVHLSASQALGHVAAARDAGRRVYAETCPQYLYLTLEDQLGSQGADGDDPFDGAKWVASPPLRTKHERHHDDLWRGLRTDDLAVVSTDHCPFCYKDQKQLGRGDFRRIPNGMGTVEHRMDLLHQGVVAGRLSLPRWVETCSTTPARLFGLYPRKGVVAPGSDADLVVYDPARQHVLGAATHHMNLDHSSWEGFPITGGVETVMSRGRLVVDRGTWTGAAGHGRYLRRDLPADLR